MHVPRFRSLFALALGIALPAIAQQATTTTLPEVKVIGESGRDNTQAISTGGDSAQLLNNAPGYHVAAGGGVSGLPVVYGFADDRLKIRIDGMETSSACGNHMNPPLSYIDPTQVGKIQLIAGVTPVSLGGDSIGGTIEVHSAAPVFAQPGTGWHQEASLSAATRSVNRSLSLGASATLASESLSWSFSGAQVRAASYKDGDGKKVLGSMVESNNQALTLAVKGEGQQLSLRVGEQRIPYQGFPNQYMDMTGNHATFANLTHAGEFAWGKLETKLYWQDTEHSMGFFTPERSGTMPMNTHGRDIGYALKAELPMPREGTLRLGNEYHGSRLDDSWPAVPGSMMMGPQSYVNINDGKRDRYAFFAEWEAQQGTQWSTLLGIRDEIVKTDTGNVQAYGNGMMNAADAAASTAFNARSHAKRDNNIDATALARFTPDAASRYEFGYARKTRSPNLYERYAWGRGTMAMTMTNWFGDGNGYVGDIDLKPEVAHTLSASADWHDADKQGWSVKLSPYYSYVKNYIDTDLVGSFNPYSSASANGNLLRFANHDARLYGINISWKLPLSKTAAWGDIQFKGNASLTRGSRTDGTNLYRMMPFNALLTIEQAIGAWSNAAEAQLVSRKTQVDSLRLEPMTAGYALFNLRSAYQWASNTSVTAGISNLFNKNYADPLGGVYLSELKSTGSGSLQALPGYGRSLDLGVSIKF